MMGERRVDQGALFYEFSLERHVPQDHLLRSIDRFVDLEGVRKWKNGGDGGGRFYAVKADFRTAAANAIPPCFT